VLVHRGDDVPAARLAVAAFSYMRAAPLIARLFDSVAPEVKMISFASAPISSAHCSRAFSTASSASQPKAWLRLPGLP
jgi:hypothetical protein